MRLTYLLNEAVSSIHNLKDYYVSQIDYLEEQVRDKTEQYKYGVALEKFFFCEALSCHEKIYSDEEKALVDEILEEYNVEKTEENVAIHYKLKTNRTIERTYELHPRKASTEYNKLNERPQILNDSTLMMLLVRYEESISGIYKYLINKYPNAYLADKSISYAELISIDSNIEYVKSRFIDRVVEEIMRQPISDWYELFKSKHKAFATFNNNEFEKFKEIYYRRNLVVHNQGLVNDVYIANTQTTLKRGEEVEVDKKYLLEAFELTQIILYGTFWGLKRVSSDPDELQNCMFEIGFKHMLDAEWKLSEYVYKVLMEEKEQPEADRLCSIINYWISIKNQNRFFEIEENIRNFDVSARSGQFKVAKFALLDDFKQVNNILEEEIKKEVTPLSIETWPLFIQYRESEEYKEFKELHQSFFEMQGYEPEFERMEEDEESVLDEYGEVMEGI